ncbi:hypothetical protein DICSQDRAFT_147956 [Dichomitus squalens LYAD-421 SS1]|uniref:Uncharacterized protein n=1 Tax=Dichomitus squalens (strain LYAD-421) TaxID=732165 RepID=R7SVR6_DICSQ|nr:uncharacterized protein DICSQDRAFT_147956 [Dichomitus squalens LYAD-421 SS1]EJF60279.1 hypothetical protein DICSQDRAFT_147956 [Dichomitus squalens LYAD-421 SS1]
MEARLRSSDAIRELLAGGISALGAFGLSQDFLNAVLHSAAVYRLGSLALPVTFLWSLNIKFYVSMCLLSPLMGQYAIIELAHTLRIEDQQYCIIQAEV